MADGRPAAPWLLPVGPHQLERHGTSHNAYGVFLSTLVAPSGKNSCALARLLCGREVLFAPAFTISPGMDPEAQPPATCLWDQSGMVPVPVQYAGSPWVIPLQLEKVQDPARSECAATQAATAPEARMLTLLCFP